jgi:hypothetical protein
MLPLSWKQPWVVALCLATTSECRVTQHGCSSEAKDGSGIASSAAAGAHFVRVEDLPRVGFVRVDDLAPAPVVAVRPLQGRELTPELVHRAEHLIRKEEAPFGTQVIVEAGDRKYIARFEWHYHDDLSGERPQGWHKGVTLYTTE